MTELEIKARELVIKFQFQEQPLMFEQAKIFAIMLVNEILEVLGSAGVYNYADSAVSDYWENVKSEIQKL